MFFHGPGFPVDQGLCHLEGAPQSISRSLINPQGPSLILSQLRAWQELSSVNSPPPVQRQHFFKSLFKHSYKNYKMAWKLIQ